MGCHPTEWCRSPRVVAAKFSVLNHMVFRSLSGSNVVRAHSLPGPPWPSRLAHQELICATHAAVRAEASTKSLRSSVRECLRVCQSTLGFTRQQIQVVAAADYNTPLAPIYIMRVQSLLCLGSWESERESANNDQCEKWRSVSLCVKAQHGPCVAIVKNKIKKIMPEP